MAQKAIRVISAAASLRHGWTQARLTSWCDEHSLRVDSYREADGYVVAIMQGQPDNPKGPQCAAPGVHGIVIRMGVVEQKWWE